MELGIYESLITETLRTKIDQLDKNTFFIADDKKLDASEAVYFLSLHLTKVISKALQAIKVSKGESVMSKQIEVTNKILEYLGQEIETYTFNDDLLEAEGKILEGVFNRLNEDHVDLNLRLSEIMPATRLSQSELFTGGNIGLSLESELKKEIRSADRIDLLVSFIKWKAIVILRDAFEEFTTRGGVLRIITTTYMGASDAKAIEELSKLPNTTVKVSYNTSNERLHAKAYLFYRKTGYHTGYIGSSNFSRSALTDGLEWNVKVTTKEIPHIIDKFQKTFESYWNQAEFEIFDASKLEHLKKALKSSGIGKSTNEVVSFFDLKPYHYQSEILEKLSIERKLHQCYKNLVVAATGTGKTMIAAFDFKRFREEHPNAKLLFIAHRIEILKQALNTFRNVLKDQNFGELYGGGYEPTSKNVVFATVQTFNNLVLENFCSPEYYDYLVLDEAHHGIAGSYQKIVHYFNPKIILGLTATPERMDGGNILTDFNYRIAAEIRLPDALNNKLLTPFQYFGVSDNIDYSKVKWNKGKYDVNELNNIYTANDLRVRDVITNLEKYTKDYRDVKCVGFCVSIEHAEFMSRKFNAQGLKADSLVSTNSSNRLEIVDAFRRGDINYLFVVDIFNEGVDIPEIDTVLFLRPTESLTIFLQQLGRGLRLHDSKDVLTVLDFVGQVRDEYDFESKFRALIGKTNTTVEDEIKKDFPHLPLGSSIVLEKKAKEYILNNIRKATDIGKRALINRFQMFSVNFNCDLTLQSFLEKYNLSLAHIYKNHTYTTLYSLAFNTTYDTSNEDRYKTMIARKLMVTESLSYFQFVLSLFEIDFDITQLSGNKTLNKKYALMLYYDFYGKANENDSLENAILVIGQNKDFINELYALLKYKISQIAFEEIDCVDLDFECPLKIHSRYTRDQILVALELSTFESQSSNREGVALNSAINTEALFINLHKSEKDFSPTTMYDDYAINERLFHWQSQNSSRPDSGKGKSYVQQKQNNKKILLFVRESKNDVNGFTQGYVFLGPANFVSYEGAKPMSIQWQLHEPIPHYMWKESAKMIVG